jgi:hypothetical protein
VSPTDNLNVDASHANCNPFYLLTVRSCFLYLFPSHQTWYLVLIFFAFS